MLLFASGRKIRAPFPMRDAPEDCKTTSTHSVQYNGTVDRKSISDFVCMAQDFYGASNLSFVVSPTTEPLESAKKNMVGSRWGFGRAPTSPLSSAFWPLVVLKKLFFANTGDSRWPPALREKG